MRKRLMCHFLPVIQVLFSIFMISCTDVVGSKQEGDALKMFIASVDPGGKVAKQWSSEDPCRRTAAWLGVKCTGANALNVTSLILDKMNLTGSIPEGIFSQLTELRILSLSGNGLTGHIPSDLIHCAQLKQLYLEDNALSGPIPSPLSHRLKRIDLSNNKLTGAIPSSLGDIDGLLTLFLDSNMLEGGIPSLNQQSLIHFNISNNNLSGEIPSTISSRSFSASVFMGNALLCGSPLQSCSGRLQQQVLGSDSIGMSNSQKASGQKKLTASTIIVIIFASIAFVLITLCLIIYCYYYKGIRCVSEGPKAKKKIVPSEREDFQSMISTASAGDEDKPRLVFFEENNTFRLEELLRASAELLGKGSLGCAYKAVLEDGRALCVKRLNNNNNVARSEFEEQMELVGRLRHPNVVPLWAYYYAKEEKLLVYQYQPNGNLHDLLLAGEQMQGNGGGAMTLKPLSWKARLRIAKGIAKGLAYLHRECETQNMPHGNIKASNILIDKDNEARIADFGLAWALSLNGKAPHSLQVRVTQKADVYSFGVVLLELLTGRVAQDNEEEEEEEDHAFNLPQWVTSVVKEEWSAEVFDRSLMASISSEDSLIKMLQIAMACTSNSPDQRPHMAQVHKMIADIHAEELTASYSTSISMDQLHKMIAHIHEEELTASYSTSISMDQARFQFVSNDDSTMMSTQAPYYDNHEASFRF